MVLYVLPKGGLASQPEILSSDAKCYSIKVGDNEKMKNKKVKILILKAFREIQTCQT